MTLKYYRISLRADKNAFVATIATSSSTSWERGMSGRGVEKSKNDLLTPAELLLLLGTSESTQACLVRMSSLHTRRGTAKDINVPTKWNKMNYLNRIAVTQAQGWLRLQLDNGCKFNSPTLLPSTLPPLSPSPCLLNV